MKQFYLICMLLLVSLATFGRDVTVHVTDQRGAAVSGLPVQFDNESFDTDANGDFVIKELGSSGTYSFRYYKDYNYESVRFSWDGTSSAVNVSLDGYYVTFQLVGLSDEEVAQVKGSDLKVSTKGSSGATYKTMGDDGILSFWWDAPAISWEFNTKVFGDCSGEVNLEEEKGIVPIAPKNGKYKVSLGNIKGHGGAAVEHATIDGIAAEKFTVVYRTPGYYTMEFMAPGYFPYSLAYQVVNKDVAVDIDLSQSHVVKFKFTDRDGTAMENLSVTLAFDNRYSGSEVTTDASGVCEAYAMPGNYQYLPNYEKPFYTLRWESIKISDEDVAENVNLVGTTLLAVKLKNAKKFKASESNSILSYDSYLLCKDGDMNEKRWVLNYQDKEDGDDIVFGLLIEKEYTSANMSVVFQNTTKNLLGIREDDIALDGKDVNLEYDFGTYLTAKLTPPDGYSFGGKAKIDGIEMQLYMDENRDVLMPSGGHSWVAELQTADGAQTYPFGKEQTFDLKVDGERIVYAFNEDDYCGIKFLVKDENGSPANDFRVIVKQDYYEIASTRTDVDGYGTVFLSDPGNYTYEVSGNVSYGNGAYLPISKEVMVGEEMLQETVSFEGYKRLAFRVKGIEMYHDQTTESRPSVEIKEVDESFTLPLDKSVTPVEYAGSMMLPQGTYSGTVSVSDLDDHRGSVDFSVEIKGNDVAETLDFSAYRAVDFTVNQKEIHGSMERVYVFKEGQKIDEYQDGVNGDRLLPPGKYVALYQNVQYSYNDTLYFEIADKDVVVDFQFNPEDFCAVTFKMVNQPEKAKGISVVVDGRIWVGNQQSQMLRKCKHSYALSSVNVGLGYESNTWPLEGTFEIGDEDKVVEVDLSQYRVFKVKFVMPDGSELSEPGIMMESYPMYLSKEGETLTCYTDNNAYALPLGTYDLVVNKEEKYYGTLIIGTDCPDEITVQLSDKPNTIADVPTHDLELSATMQNGRICVISARSEEVEVRVYDLDGRVLWQGNVMPGSVTDTGLYGQGIYLISMKQEGCIRTQKLIVR